MLQSVCTVHFKNNFFSQCDIEKEAWRRHCSLGHLPRPFSVCSVTSVGFLVMFGFGNKIINGCLGPVLLVLSK